MVLLCNLSYLSFINNKVTFKANPVALVPIITGSDSDDTINNPQNPQKHSTCNQDHQMNGHIEHFFGFVSFHNLGYER